MSKPTKKPTTQKPTTPEPQAPPVDHLNLIPGIDDDPNRPPPEDGEPEGLTLEKLRKAEAIIASADEHAGEDLVIPAPPPGVVVTKDGRPRTVIRAELPPPPPEPRAGRAQKKSDIAAAYFHRLNPGQRFEALSLQDQALWYDRAVNAGGASK